MSEAQKSGNQNVKMVNWVRFTEKQAILKRLIDDKGNPGLILRVLDNEAGKKVESKAISAGFKARKAAGLYTMIFPKGEKVPFKTTELAEMLGGEIHQIERDRLLNNDMVINLMKRAPKVSDPDEGVKKDGSTPEKPARIMPDPDSIEVVGLNMRGEEVVRDSQGRFFRRSDDGTGVADYVFEDETGQAALWLRARKPEDLNGIAGGLLRMARRGTMHQADFDRVLDAALEEGPHGKIDISREEAWEHLRKTVLRQVAQLSMDDDASRAAFHQALRVAANTSYVLSQDSDETLNPSPAFLVFMRRIAKGFDAVDFSGSDDLNLGMPRIHSQGANLQVHDLTNTAPGSMAEMAAHILSRRPDDGSSIFFVPADLDEDIRENMRSMLGCAYGLEATAEITASISDGKTDGKGLIAFFIGDRRPETLEGLPQAALRNFTVATQEDLLSLEQEVIRSRRRIRDFNKGEVELAESQNEDDREENVRQRPYQPLSRVGEPFTMIPLALEGSTARSLTRVARDAEPFGGADAVIAQALGRSVSDLGDILTPEQVDALAMRHNAAERDRAFLLADQTGVGKGRTCAAVARSHIRSSENARVIYFTESAGINVPDVMRDMKGVGAMEELRVLFLTAGSNFVDVTIDPATGEEIHREITSPAPSVRRRIFEEGVWPEGYNMIITNYSQFNANAEDVRSEWIANMGGDETAVVLDEAHNALNEKSNTGRNIRALLETVPNGNVLFASGTPLRDPKGVSLYAPCMPRTNEDQMKGILENLHKGGEVAQEAFTTMLAEDGVMIRRDHDLSSIDFQVHLPDDAMMRRYQEIMNQFSPIVEALIDASSQIGEMAGRSQALHYRAMINQGMDPRQARSMTNELSQYSISLGGPLSQLARITMNAIKVDQMVVAAVSEMDQNRKPLITFHSTNAALLNEVTKHADGTRMTPEEIEALPTMSLRDQIRRIHESIYKVKIDGEVIDPRQTTPELQQSYENISALIAQLPEELSVSPIDDLVEKLEANNIRVGEISGRTLCYRNGQIEKRSKEERDRKATVDSFNDGDLDALVYNSAGATGGSYHASPHFKDQRGRTMLEMEAPVDVIKYVQSQGRGNRYGQVAKPKIVSVMTGLTPEMRILQQRNGKLRSLGASVDGNRSHPLLLDDVPDFLNAVGDEATHNVLMASPALARRLGFPKYAEEEQLAVQGVNNTDDTGSGSVKNGTESLANKVLARSIMLPAHEQDELVQRIRMEFDVLIEELNSRNANPLKPKTYGGTVDVKTRTIFSGIELDDDDLDTSVFLSPVYMATGIHDLGETPVKAEHLVSMVERAITMHGAEGFKPHAERITQNLAGLMRPYLPFGYDMDRAMEEPNIIPGRFPKEYNKLTDIAWLLENMQPGVSIKFPSLSDPDGLQSRTIVDLVPPKDPRHYDMASAYKIKTITAGDAKPETIALSRILFEGIDNVRFRPGISEEFNEAYLTEFSEIANMRRQMPVQILDGNVLQAINVAAENKLGTISLYRDLQGQVSRGILVNDAKVNMSLLPVHISSAEIAAETAMNFVRGAGNYSSKDTSSFMRIWGTMDPKASNAGERMDADIIITLTSRKAKIDMVPLRRSNAQFFRERPGLYSAVWGEPWPDKVPMRPQRRPGTKHKYLVELDMGKVADREQLYEILSLMDNVPMQCDSRFREIVNDTVNYLGQHGPQGALLVHERDELEADRGDQSEMNIEADAEAEATEQDGQTPAQRPADVQAALEAPPVEQEEVEDPQDEDWEPDFDGVTF
jgi:hypothetical protein